LKADDYGLAAYLKMKKVSPREAKNKLEQLKEERNYFIGFTDWLLTVKRKGIE